VLQPSPSLISYFTRREEDTCDEGRKGGGCVCDGGMWDESSEINLAGAMPKLASCALAVTITHLLLHTKRGGYM